MSQQYFDSSNSLIPLEKLTSKTLPEAIIKNNFNDVRCIFERKYDGPVIPCAINDYYDNNKYYGQWSLLGLAISVSGREEEKKKIIEYLIQQGADINKSCRSDLNMPPICEATLCTELFKIKLLVEHDANINVVDRNGWSPLYSAFRGEKWETFKYLIEHNADVNESFEVYDDRLQRKKKTTFLQEAIAQENKEIIVFLLEKGARVDEVCIKKATLNKNAEILRLLNEAKDAAQNAVPPAIEDALDSDDSSENTADQEKRKAKKIYDAYLLKQENNQRAIEREKEDQEKQEQRQKQADKQNAKKALKDEKETQRQIKTELIKKLKKNDLKGFKECFISATQICLSLEFLGDSELLHKAAYYNADLIIEFLLEPGFGKPKDLLEFSVNMENKKGLTPLHVAVRQGKFKAIQVLVDEDSVRTQKVNINATDADGWTPLHFAAFNGYFDIVKFLVTHGANPNLKTYDNETARSLAKENEHFKICQYLIKKKEQQQKSSSSSSSSFWKPENKNEGKKNNDESCSEEEKKDKNRKNKPGNNSSSDDE